MNLAERNAHKQRIQDDMNKLVKTQRVDKDNTARFKLIGGKWHGNIVRLTAPFDTLRFPDGETYDISGPLRKGGAWVYIHTPTTEKDTDGQPE
jgi:hypothetical protein